MTIITYKEQRKNRQLNSFGQNTISSSDLEVAESITKQRTKKMIKATGYWVAAVLVAKPELRKVCNRNEAIKQIKDKAAQYGWPLNERTIDREIRHIINTIALFGRLHDPDKIELESIHREIYGGYE